MNTRTLLSIGSAAMALGGVAIVAAAAVGTVAEAGTRSPADLAKRAARALARHDPTAVTLAEQAVAAAPGEAEYRAVLGRAYLQAGRFASARDAFVDTLRLRPTDGRSALNLVLATIATGDWQGARVVLAAHEADIPAADRGLALALAGDPAGGAAVLTQAAREPGATGKTRQNLALALALSGQWPLARAVAEADMSPGDVDRRLAEWAQFAQPVAASDQVAALLGVRAVPDRGQPVALALATPLLSPASAPSQPVLAVATAEPVAPPATLAAAVETAPAMPGIAAPGPSRAPVTFGPRHEVVQALPTPLIRGTGPIKVALATAAPLRAAPFRMAAPTTARGEWHVQLGAFDNAAVAHDAWGRISRRYAGIAGHRPQGASYRAGSASLYRLSVGGFDRTGADRLCRSVRASGGVCFVRRAAGDALAQWSRAGVRMAAI